MNNCMEGLFFNKKSEGLDFSFLAFNNGVGVNDSGSCQYPKTKYRGMEQSGSSSGS